MDEPLILPRVKALAEATRLRLVNILLHHELHVSELVGILALGQSRVSHHLKILSGCGLLESRRDGLRVYYSAAREGDGRTLLEALSPLLDQDRVLERDLALARQAIAERTQASRQFFDATAGEWDALRREVLGGVDLEVEILERMGDCFTAVDLGCGTGHMLEALSRKARQVIGVDASPRMLEEARQHFAGRDEVSLRIGELEHLPLRDAEADFAVLSMALHHLADPRAGLWEAHRVLRTGGELVVADFSKHRDETMRDIYGDHWLGFDTDELAAWLTEAGFAAPTVTTLPVKNGLTVQLLHTTKP
jgi:ArsR family transcriptional regulator